VEDVFHVLMASTTSAGGRRQANNKRSKKNTYNLRQAGSWRVPRRSRVLSLALLSFSQKGYIRAAHGNSYAIGNYKGGQKK
jgi:hypothetical protein